MPDIGANGPLTGYRVLDLAQPIGYHCGKLLGDMGAEVIKIEPPGGDPARHTPPFKDGLPGAEQSLYFLHYNTNKRGVTLDLTTPDGREIFLEMVKHADVVLETSKPGTMEGLKLDYASLAGINPGIIMASITPFGQTGPWKEYRATDIAGLAMGNPMAISGEPGLEPLQAPGELAYGMASTYGAFGIAVALYHRMDSGLGQYIDVSMDESAAHIAGYAVPHYSHEEVKPFRSSRRADVVDLYDAYRTKNGFVRLFIIPAEQWRSLVRWIVEDAANAGVESPDHLTEPAFENFDFRRQNTDVVHAAISEFCQRHTKEELYEEGQRRHIGVSPVNTPVEFINSAHTQARGVFVDMEHPVVGKYKQFGPVPRFSGSPGRLVRTAPLIGQDNEAVYCGELGFSKQDLAALAAARVI
jgi:crotonobetainyl-CoA:carnitine CoA-transferase CaiB-like acyl-CoA transferase